MLRCCVLPLHKSEVPCLTRVAASATPRQTPFLPLMRRVRLHALKWTRQTSGGSTEKRLLSSAGRFTFTNCKGQRRPHGVSTAARRRRTPTPYSSEKYCFSRLHEVGSETGDGMDPHFSNVLSQDMRVHEVVLTPATVLQRLEGIFPPKASEARKRESRGYGKPTGCVTESMLSTSLPFCESDALADRLRPCCHPVPWECVLLSRVDAPTSSWERERKRITRSCSSTDPTPKLLTTPAVYNVFVPVSFLFDPDVNPIMPSLSLFIAGEGGGGRGSSLYSTPPSVQRRAECVSRNDHPEGIVESFGKLWRVAVLHHIPGLPDPTAVSMTLEEYSQFLQYSASGKKLQKSIMKCTAESKSVMHCMGRDGMNNRAIGIHSVRKRLVDEAQHEQGTDEVHLMSIGKGEKTLDGGVGVWIIHPYRESIFFALRYTTASDHYEWLYPPQHTLFQDDSTTTSTAELRDISTGDIQGNNHSASSLSWAITSLQKAMENSQVVSEGNSKQEAPRHTIMMKAILPTILYYCAAHVPLAAEEKSTVMMSLLADGFRDTMAITQPSEGLRGKEGGRHQAKKGEMRGTLKQRHHTHKPVAQLALTWAPLPRTSRLLRGRQLTTNANTLAESLKYGLLRILR